MSTKLTIPQQKALFLLGKTSYIGYSPGESLYVGKENIRWDVARKLIKMELAEGYNVHPWGPFPIYGIQLTEKGKKLLENLAHSQK